MTISNLRIAFGLVAVSLAALLGGCGADRGGERAEDPGRAAAGLVAAFGQASSNEFNLAKGPVELALQSDLIVKGRFTNFAAGPRWIAEYPGFTDVDRSIVGEFAVDDVLRGELPAGAGGKVYLQDFQGIPGPDEYNRYVPDDIPALLYLRRQKPAEELMEGPVRNPTAGRPPGQPAFTDTTSQGVLFEVGGSVVAPLEGTVYPGQDLDRLGPTKLTFPAERDLDLAAFAPPG